MLIQLEVENVAIIEKLNIPLYKGFIVLTGETGAGKSIIIDSLNALLGSRISRELIRSGADKASVQGLFSYAVNDNKLIELLESMGIEPQDDQSILISRTFTESGKNVCRVNGSMVTVGMLRELGQRLVDIHGQHDNQSLLRAETHIELLDLFAGEKLATEKVGYNESLQKLNALKTKLRALAGLDKERERTLDTLRFQIGEIEAARLYIGEDTELEAKSRIFAHSEDIISAFSNAYKYLRGEDDEDKNALDKIGFSLEAIRKVGDINSDYMDISNALEEIEEKLTDISRDIREIKDGTEYDPKVHKNVEERISLIQGLKRKYGETIEEVLKYLNDSKERLDEI
ncbi:MAG: AAA family ATPase [Clostridiaceae bacterium]|nr:AAA family ATPase [Clostridiaceae bacterium]